MLILAQFCGYSLPDDNTMWSEKNAFFAHSGFTFKQIILNPQAKGGGGSLIFSIIRRLGPVF